MIPSTASFFTLLVLVLIIVQFTSATTENDVITKESKLHLVHNLEDASNKIHLRGVNRHFSGLHSQWIDNFDETFFVAIAAFRDIQCHLSISDMMRKATNPRRVILGIIEQNEHGDPACIPDHYWECNSGDFCPLDNIRRRRTVSRKGRGPCFGRYISMLLYRGEEYYMMMDSHIQFLLHWETKSIAQLHRARSSRPSLSHYPNGWDKDGRTFESQSHVIVMCQGRYVAMGYSSMAARAMVRVNEPRMQAFSAGGYLMANAKMVHEVPFDPYLDYLFDGEEILYSTRMFTHGYDIHTPGEGVLFHDYRRHTAIRYWTVQNSIPGNEKWHQEVDVSQDRARLIMEIPKENSTELMVDRNNPNLKPRVLKEFDKYTAGKARSMAAYNAFAALDAPNRKAHPDLCNFLERETVQKSGK
jgi:UDP-GlcNAc:polypeptide alpha-N-acetylglucosaminyltransferase